MIVCTDNRYWHCILPVLLLIIATAAGISNDGTVSFADDDALSMMQADVNGWSYPVPKASDPPNTVRDDPFPFAVMDSMVLVENKKRMLDSDHEFQHALWFLKKKADQYVKNDTQFSVMKKTIAVPDNDPHDYMSLARYFWPNKSHLDGLPYIRDEKVNPETSHAPDDVMFHEFVKHVEYLSLAYHFFDNETYAARATEHIHRWFIDPDTRMNPHLQYASLVRGYHTGRAKGIIDFHTVPKLLDAIAVLQYSQAWKPRMSATLRYWFAHYLEWLTKSPNGIFERESQDNHGTYYDIQCVAIYRFLGQNHLARQVLQNATAARIAQQILPSGEQYLETGHHRLSWFYSVFNLHGLFQLAQHGRLMDVDLFGFKTADGKGIQTALDFLMPYSMNESAWRFHNEGGFNSSSSTMVELFQLASFYYKNDTYNAAGNLLAAKYTHRYNITRLALPWDTKGDYALSEHTDKGQAPFQTPPVALATWLTLLSIVVGSMSFL